MADTRLLVTAPALLLAAEELRRTAAAVGADVEPNRPAGEVSGVAASAVDAAMSRFCTGFAHRLGSQSAGLETAARRYAAAEAGNAAALLEIRTS